MFGYVHISPDKLNGEEQQLYRACYCGLCHTLGRRYGVFARMILNYDLVFLAMLLSDGEAPGRGRRRCLIHPIHPRCFCEETQALDAAADVSVLLTWWQLRDGVADHGFWGGWKYRFLSLLLHRAYRKAKARQPELDKRIQTNLDKLSALEREKCAIPDEAADTFALLLRDMAALSPPGIKRRVLEEMLYHLGRWIYLVDALDDLKEDSRSGSYNPLLQRYGTGSGWRRRWMRLSAPWQRPSSWLILAAGGGLLKALFMRDCMRWATPCLTGPFKSIQETEKAKGKAGPNNA